MEPYEIEVRERDKNKGNSPAGITMTSAEWDRRYLLGLLDFERSNHRDVLLAALEMMDLTVAQLRAALDGGKK